MNRTLKILMLSDIFVLTGFGLFDPILAIFVKEELAGGTIFAAGLASTIFFITKSIIQLPFSRYVDTHDEKVKWLFLGTLLLAVVPFIFIVAKDIKLIYLAQFIRGVGTGLAFPTWLGIWSVNLDKKHESFEWSLYATLTGIGIAVTASAGAAIAQFVGYKFTFLLTGLLSVIGCLLLLALSNSKEKIKKMNITHYYQKKKLSPKNGN